jgi:hypothetical protein
MTVSLGGLASVAQVRPVGPAHLAGKSRENRPDDSGNKSPWATTVLTDRVVTEIVDALAAGLTLSSAAARAGVAPRTIRHWTGRARSRDPADAAFVDAERKITGAIAVAQMERRRSVRDGEHREAAHRDRHGLPAGGVEAVGQEDDHSLALEDLDAHGSGAGELRGRG